MSCGLHDVVALELRGVPAVCVGTAPFRDEAVEQAEALGMPRQRLLEVPHPIQPLPDAQVAGYADAALPEVLARLTGP